MKLWSDSITFSGSSFNLIKTLNIEIAKKREQKMKATEYDMQKQFKMWADEKVTAHVRINTEYLRLQTKMKLYETLKKKKV